MTCLIARSDIVLENFPLFCCKCKQETLQCISCNEHGRVIMIVNAENDRLSV